MRWILLLFTLSACGAEPDKLAHFSAGFVASEIVSRQTGDPWKGCAAAIGFGVLKELYDQRSTGFNDRDLLATGLGGCGFVWVF